MSKYDEEVDNCNVICPYCKSEYQPEPENYSDDTMEERCDNCGKSYYHYDDFSVSHNTRPDCELNNEQHVWESITLKSGIKHDFCDICGICKPYK